MKQVIVSAFVILAISLQAIFASSSVQAADGVAPDIKHGQAGYEQCLTCHAPQGLKPIPASHATYTQATCLVCHKYAAAPVVTQTPTVAPITTTPVSTGPAATPTGTPQPTVTQPPVTTPPARGGDSNCLVCHGQPGLSMDLANGEKLSLYVDSKVVDGSIHGNKLLCTDCHNSITAYPHPQIKISSLRDYSLSQYELCKQCHYANYTKSLDSVHYKGLASGDVSAPLCTDCHGSHNVAQPNQPRSKISTTCSKCHQDINSQYIQSVHGKALIEDNNFDVPVCTDCHPSHTIQDPTTAAFRDQSVDLCSNCHSNAVLMKKYDISTNVVQSYLQDFHGATVSIMSKQNKDIWVRTAVCTDCHGVHDIKMVTDANSSVIKANLVATCEKCHPDSSTNFPGAWLSHYEPTISKAPLVFLVQWFYRIMIPFIIVGLSIHIIVDLWRALTNR